MSRSYNKSSGNSVRSDATPRRGMVGPNAQVDRWVGNNNLDTGVRNLFQASAIPAEMKPVAIEATQRKIERQVANLGGNEGQPGSGVAAKAEELANNFARAMVEGDGYNGLEDYFPKSMSIQFVNALGKDGYTPGPSDPDTIFAIGNIITARLRDPAFIGGGNLETRVSRDADGYRIAVYTSVYRGRDDDGEKSYENGPEKEIAFIPHDEVSRKAPASYEERLTSPAYLKANALRSYLDALTLTSGG